VQYAWKDGLALAVNTDLATDLDNPSLGITVVLRSPVVLSSVASAAWVSRDNQVGIEPDLSAWGALSPVYLTAVNDARLTIHGGSVRLRLSRGFLQSNGLLEANPLVISFSEEAGQWQLLHPAIGISGLEVTLPSHSASLAVASRNGELRSTLNALLGFAGYTGGDHNDDGRLDVADVPAVLP
jgi:hypothetical protein